MFVVSLIDKRAPRFAMRSRLKPQENDVWLTNKAYRKESGSP
jgi:hypothetical protein